MYGVSLTLIPAKEMNIIAGKGTCLISLKVHTQH